MADSRRLHSLKFRKVIPQVAFSPSTSQDEPDKSGQESDLVRVECPVCGALLFRVRIEGQALIEIKCDCCSLLRFLSFPVVDYLTKLPITTYHNSAIYRGESSLDTPFSQFPPAH